MTSLCPVVLATRVSRGSVATISTDVILALSFFGLITEKGKLIDGIRIILAS
jgi:hypothetical protein